MLNVFCNRYAGSSYLGGLLSPITSYSSPADISSHISSYPGIDPYSGYHDSTVHSDIPSYAFDHHDHHHDHDFHDHHHDFEHHHDYDHHSSDNYYPDHSHGISSPGGDSPQPSFQPSPSDMKDAQGDSPAMTPTYRRVGKHRRRRAVKPQVE